MTDDLYRLGLPEDDVAASVEQASTVLTREALLAAMERVRADTGYHPTTYGPIHPAHHDGICDALGKPRGSDLTFADVNEFLRRTYAAADEDGKTRLLAASFGLTLDAP